MKILITSVGSNTAISVIKGLKISNNSYEIFGTDTNDFTGCAGKIFVDHFFQICPANETEIYENIILQIINKYKIDCVIPIHDLEILIHSKLKEKHPNLTFWAVNNESIINLCNNKLASSLKAKEFGLLVPEIYLTGIPSRFPAIAKPLDGISSKGIKIITSQEELDAFKLKHNINKYIIQDFIPGQEYTVDCYSFYSGGFYGCMPRKRLEVKEGISTKGITVNNTKLQELCRHFLDSLDYRGACNIQFIAVDKMYYFLEINPRFAGGGILSYKANFNSAYFTTLEVKGIRLPRVEDLRLRYNLKMVRYWEETFYEI